MFKHIKLGNIRLIALIMAIVMTALTLTSCSGPLRAEAGAAQTEEETREAETPAETAAEPEALSAEEVARLYGIYLTDVWEACRTRDESQDTQGRDLAKADAELTDTSPYWIPASGAELGYTFADLNADGQPELMIGPCGETPENEAVYDILTVRDGEVAVVFSGGLHETCEVYEDGTILDSWTEDSENSGQYLYEMSEDGLQLLQSIRILDDGEHRTVSIDEDGDGAFEREFTDEDVSETIEVRAERLALYWEPLSPENIENADETAVDAAERAAGHAARGPAAGGSAAGAGTSGTFSPEMNTGTPASGTGTGTTSTGSNAGTRSPGANTGASSSGTSIGTGSSEQSGAASGGSAVGPANDERPYCPASPDHQHHWAVEDITVSHLPVSHLEPGSYQMRTVTDEEEWWEYPTRDVYQCQCGEWFDSEEEWNAHSLWYMNNRNDEWHNHQTNSWHAVETGEVIHHPAVTHEEEVWVEGWTNVIDVPGYDEVVTMYICTYCAETRDYPG